MGRGVPLPTPQMTRVSGGSPDKTFWHILSFKSPSGNKKCAIFADSVTQTIEHYFVKLQKRDFMNPVQDCGNMPRKWENSAKSGKVGMSAKTSEN